MKPSKLFKFLACSWLILFFTVLIFSCDRKKKPSGEVFHAKRLTQSKEVKINQKERYYEWTNSWKYVEDIYLAKDTFLLKEYLYSCLSPNISDVDFYQRIGNVCKSSNLIFGNVQDWNETFKNELDKKTHKENVYLVHDMYFNSCWAFKKLPEDKARLYQDWFYKKYEHENPIDIKENLQMYTKKFNEIMGCD